MLHAQVVSLNFGSFPPSLSLVWVPPTAPRGRSGLGCFVGYAEGRGRVTCHLGPQPGSVIWEPLSLPRPRALSRALESHTGRSAAVKERCVCPQATKVRTYRINETGVKPYRAATDFRQGTKATQQRNASLNMVLEELDSYEEKKKH